MLTRRFRYDLHKIPGPKSWPIVGNLPDILGAKGLHLHKVSWTGYSWQAQALGKLQRNHIKSWLQSLA